MDMTKTTMVAMILCGVGAAAPAVGAAAPMHDTLERLARLAPERLGSRGYACVNGITGPGGEVVRVQVKVTSRKADHEARRLVRSVTTSKDVTTVRVSKRWSQASMTRVRRGLERLMNPYASVSAISGPPVPTIDAGPRRCGEITVTLVPGQAGARKAAETGQRRYGADRVRIFESSALPT